MENNFHIADLIVKKIRGVITAEEQTELDTWIKMSHENAQVFNRAIDPEVQRSKLEVYQLFNKKKVWSDLEKELFPTKTRFLPTNRFLRYAAAIILPLMVLGGSIYFYSNRTNEFSFAELDTEIQPGSSKAVLILSDGKAIDLEKDGAAHNIREGSSTISNLNQVLSYASIEDNLTQEQIYNELRIPTGGNYRLDLSDGTVVWLNSESSLRFPVSFTDSTRDVYLEGEGFFEVSPNGKPFVVHANDMDVRVLGTSFNVSAYPDGSDFKTTLVEGSVKLEIRDDNNELTMEKLLKPNDQGVWQRSSSDLSVSSVNTSFYTSWMQGKIEFNNEDLGMVMLRLSRWYGFTYQFENPEARKYHFSARLNQDEKISSILEMLEMTTDVKFDYKDGSIIIL